MSKNWSTYVGAAIAAVCAPVAFVPASGALHLRVATGDWKRELNSLRPELLRNLPDAIDGVPVQRLAFHPSLVRNA